VLQDLAIAPPSGWCGIAASDHACVFCGDSATMRVEVLRVSCSKGRVHMLPSSRCHCYCLVPPQCIAFWREAVRCYCYQGVDAGASESLEDGADPPVGCFFFLFYFMYGSVDPLDCFDLLHQTRT
jgi:hypothetical protein